MNLTLKAKDGHQFHAYQALPEGPVRGAVIVVQEIFGVNIHIRDVCDRFAAEGYAAIAPAIFDRIEPGFESGYSPEEIEKARSFVGKLDFDALMLDVDAARAAVADYGKVGIVGFCLGGSVAFLGATRMDGIAAASCYYGRLIQKFADETPRCPTQLHYAGIDSSIPPENYEEVRAKRPEAAFYLYENVHHGFNCDRRETFDQEAATLAWSRTMELFHSTLG